MSCKVKATCQSSLALSKVQHNVDHVQMMCKTCDLYGLDLEDGGAVRQGRSWSRWRRRARGWRLVWSGHWVCIGADRSGISKKKCPESAFGGYDWMSALIETHLSFSIGFFLLVNSSPWSVFLLMQIIKPAPRTARRATRTPTVMFLPSAHQHTWEQRQESS